MTTSEPKPVAAEIGRALRLVEFNLHVARFAHASWYADELRTQMLAAGMLDSQGRIQQRVEAQISSWLLHELGLRDEMDWQMSEPQKKLWLLDGPSLQRLAHELALAMHRDWLAQTIDAASVRALQAKVDRQALRFVVEEVPDGAFHYQSAAVDFQADSASDLSLKLTALGARTLLALLQPAWHAVRVRAQLYFDRSAGLGEVPAFESAHCDRALELICGWLIPRRFPEWAWCF
jgi:hypothetical protein